VDSKLCDAQAGCESLLTALPAALAGANLIYGTGMVDSGMALDYGKLVMDDEINQSIKHIVKGFEVTEKTLSVELIKEVGHAGDFLTHHSTLAHCADFMNPKLMDRVDYEQWKSTGATDLHQRALERARQVLETHEPPALPPQTQKEIDEIIRETEKELGIAAPR
jgi:trimethylamine--corrinoid protein Co-methyltransferase